MARRVLRAVRCRFSIASAGIPDSDDANASEIFRAAQCEQRIAAAFPARVQSGYANARTDHCRHQAHAARAAQLAKADLLTQMVGEFPELQGVMGQYYARLDFEPEEVARACAEHYQPRFSGDTLPSTLAGVAVALADKLETLVGLFGIGQCPTSDKDPF